MSRHQWLSRGTCVLVLVATLACSGCVWQRDEYTKTMDETFAKWAQRQKYDKHLGPPLTIQEQHIWLRPPKVATAVALEENSPFLGRFQGGTPPLELLVVGRSGPESLTDFITQATAVLSDAKLAPPEAAAPAEQPTVECMHGGTTTYEVLSAAGQRGVGNSNVDYVWLLYFTEEEGASPGPTQKVMLAFLIPRDQYATLTDAVGACVESLALPSKFGKATVGGG